MSIPKAAVTRVEKMEQGGWLCYYKEGSDPEKTEQESWISADGLLVAVGRRACGEGVFSPEMAIRAGVEKGKIPADENYQTRISGIYAAGDVTGGIQLAMRLRRRDCWRWTIWKTLSFPESAGHPFLCLYGSGNRLCGNHRR